MPGLKARRHKSRKERGRRPDLVGINAAASTKTKDKDSRRITASSAAPRRAVKLPEAAARVAASLAAGHRVVSLGSAQLAAAQLVFRAVCSAQLAAVQPELRLAWPAPSSPPAWKHFAAPTRRPAPRPYPCATPSPWRTP